MTDDPFERAAKHERAVTMARTGFRIHFGVYLAVNLMLVVIWATTPHRGEALPWFVYPLLGWGIGIVAHFLATRSWVASGGRKYR